MKTLNDLDKLYIEFLNKKPKYAQNSASIVQALDALGMIDEPIVYIRDLVTMKPFIIENIEDKLNQPIYSMSAVLYLYAGIHYSPHMTEHAVNGYYKELEDIGLDLGEVWN